MQTERRQISFHNYDGWEFKYVKYYYFGKGESTLASPFKLSTHFGGHNLWGLKIMLKLMEHFQKYNVISFNFYWQRLFVQECVETYTHLSFSMNLMKSLRGGRGMMCMWEARLSSSEPKPVYGGISGLTAGGVGRSNFTGSNLSDNTPNKEEGEERRRKEKERQREREGRSRKQMKLHKYFKISFWSQFWSSFVLTNAVLGWVEVLSEFITVTKNHPPAPNIYHSTYHQVTLMVIFLIDGTSLVS